jgi:uncharacterized protein
VNETRGPLFLFAPGAGAPSTSAWMQRYAAHLQQIGTVVTLDYPYMLAGRKLPDPHAKLVAAHSEALARARALQPGPVVLIGKSMGSRMGCHVALTEPVTAVVCLGYPLQSPGPRAAVRDQVLLELRTPVLFVQGTRDKLCPLPLLQSVRERMQTTNELLVVEQGDHSLEVTQGALRKQGLTQADVEQQIIERIRNFVANR